MASQQSVKSDLKLLKEKFTKNHERFQVSQASTDQLTCRFIGGNGKSYDIHAIIPDSYPGESILWYADSDETNLMEIVEKLNETERKKYILNQIDILLRELCYLHKIQLPKEAMFLMRGESSSTTILPADKSSSIKQNADHKKEEGDDEDGACDGDELESLDSDDSSYFASESDLKNKRRLPSSRTDDLPPPLKKCHLDLMEKIEKIKSGPSASSTLATNRLMQEMREIYRWESFKNGEYSIELVDDSIYNWNIELRCIDSGSLLYRDLVRLKSKEGKDSIVLNMTFDDKYPIEPPFVRVVYPVIQCKHVVGGGAFCTELLLKQCWSPAYTIESVIMQMAALLVKGNARIDFDSFAEYSLEAAKLGFRMVKGLKTSGWFERFKESS